jgi:hypothetical protein
VSKPAQLPVWATDATFTSGPASGDAVRVEPSAGYKHQGWVPDQNPLAEYLNWKDYTTYLWCQYLNGLPTDPDFVGEDFTWSGVHEFDTYTDLRGEFVMNCAVSHWYGNLTFEDGSKKIGYSSGNEPNHTRYYPANRGYAYQGMLGTDWQPGIIDITYPGTGNASSWIIWLQGQAFSDALLQNATLYYDLTGGAGGTYQALLFYRDHLDTTTTTLAGPSNFTVGSSHSLTLNAAGAYLEPWAGRIYGLQITANGTRTLKLNSYSLRTDLTYIYPP